MVELGYWSEEKLKIFVSLEKIIIDVGSKSAKVGFIDQQ